MVVLREFYILFQYFIRLEKCVLGLTITADWLGHSLKYGPGLASFSLAPSIEFEFSSVIVKNVKVIDWLSLLVPLLCSKGFGFSVQLNKQCLKEYVKVRNSAQFDIWNITSYEFFKFEELSKAENEWVESKYQSVS